MGLGLTGTIEDKKTDNRLYSVIFAESAGGTSNEISATTDAFLNIADEEGSEKALKRSSAYLLKSKQYKKAKDQDLNAYEQEVYNRIKDIVDTRVDVEKSERLPYNRFENENAFGAHPEAKEALQSESIGRQRYYQVPTTGLLQQELKDKGYDPGVIDGLMGTNTRKAIKEFQKDEGLKVDGVAGKNTWKELLSSLSPFASEAHASGMPTEGLGLTGEIDDEPSGLGLTGELTVADPRESLTLGQKFLTGKAGAVLDSVGGLFKGIASGITGIPQMGGQAVKAFGSNTRIQGERLIEQSKTTGFRDVYGKPIQKEEFKTNPIIVNALRDAERKIEGGKRLEEKGQIIIKENEDFQKKIGVTPENLEGVNRFSYVLGHGATSILASTGLYAVTGGAATPAIAFGVNQAISVFNESLESDKPLEESYLRAFGAGGAEAALEGVGLNFLMKKYGNKITSGLIRGIENALQEAAQSGTENIATKGLKGRSGKLLEGVGESALVGFILGGGTSVISESIVRKDMAKSLQEMGVKYEDIPGIVDNMLYKASENVKAMIDSSVVKDLKENVVAKLKDKKGELRFAAEPQDLKSNLKAVTSTKLPNVVNAEQALKTLINAGVNKEEIEFSGVEDFVKNKGKVSKQELLDYVEENKVKVDTVVKGKSALDRQELIDGKEFKTIFMGYDDVEYEAKVIVQYDEDSKELKVTSYGYYDPETREWEDTEVADEWTEQQIMEDFNINKELVMATTKYSQYQLPGGKNYKESLVTLPSKRDLLKFDAEKIGEKYGLKLDEISIEKLNKKGAIEKDIKLFRKWMFPAEGDFRDFTTSHWDEPNVVVHHRTNERTDSEGNKVLFVEEIQSDWHREGKKKGYDKQLSDSAKKVLTDRILDIQKRLIPEATLQENANRLRELSSEEDAIQRKLTVGAGVPSAPFKKTWHELALKDIIRQAVENGQDKVAWISGEQTADRYDLSKHLDSVSWESLEDRRFIKLKGLKGISGQDIEIVTEGSKVFSVDMGGTQEWIGKELSDVLGKDIAKKILEKDEGALTGEGLSVGGKWAETFYDKILPSTASKYIKKWGSSVESISIGDTIQQGFAITPQMKIEVSKQGQPMFGNRLAGHVLTSKRGMATGSQPEELPENFEERPLIFDELEKTKKDIIPKFKSTEEALEFGKKATPEQIKELQTEKERVNKLTDKIQAIKEPTDTQLQEGMNLATEGQLLREAIEAGEKKVEPVKKEEPLIEEAKKHETIEEFEKSIPTDTLTKTGNPILIKSFHGTPEKKFSYGEEGYGLMQVYEKQKDIWIGNKDVRLVLEIPAEKKKLQIEIKNIAGTKQYGDLAKNYDMAIQLYIDNKRNPQQVKNLYSKLSPEKQKLVDLSKNLPPEIQKVANKISESYEQIGVEALSSEVIRNVLDNYTGRVWDIEGKPVTQKFRKFGTSTRHAKKRVFDTIVEGWSKGYNLKIKGATNNLAILKEEIIKTIEDKRFIKALQKVKDVDGNPLLTTKHLPGYIKVEHSNFKQWKHAGKAIPGEVYGRNAFVDDKGNLFERQELYAPARQARNLNNILGISKLKGIYAIDKITKYNAVLKAWILQTSLFHHMAFGRSYYLGTNRKHFKEMNPIDAVNDGNRMIDELNPIIVHAVRNGLTLGRKQDWNEDLLREKTIIGAFLDKNKVSKEIKDKILQLRESQADFLFGVIGSGLKAKAFAIEYRNQIRKYPNENVDVVAKRVANLINDDFGGLHLQRMGRNPTVQHIFRLFVLASDWTESNIRTMVKSFKGGKEGAMYRDFWAGIFAKGLTATMLANMAMAAFDEDDKEGKGLLERFYRNYKKAFKEGRYLGLDVDITPVYKACGGESDDRYYFSILGHFKDPLKLTIRNVGTKKGTILQAFKLGNTRAMKHKSSVIGGMFLDYLTGTDYAERRFTTFKELIGRDKEKGLYKTTRKGKYKKGDPKWGKLKGKTVVWDYTKRGSVELEQLPSFLINEAKGAQPVQAQQMMNYFAGEIDGFFAIGNALGLGIKKTYGKPEKKKLNRKEKRIKELKEKILIYEKMKKPQKFINILKERVKNLSI